jgi:SAM-dependent methyltransferase
MLRTGSFVAEDEEATYQAIGAMAKEEILGLLPSGWSFSGKRLLDFGCGAGRVLRHFYEESRTASVAGCDIDAPSIEWIALNLPWLDAFVVDEAPPIPRPDGSYDLIWAISVFTHLTDEWAAWLVDLHRVLAQDGMLIATFLGSGMSEDIAGEPWDEDRTGMNVLRHGADWDVGGPLVLHSPWWIRGHWGRAFDIVELRPSGFGSRTDRSRSHGVVVLRRKPVRVSVADLKELEDDPREIAALQHNIEQLQQESLAFRRASAAIATAGSEVAAAERRIASLYESTVSWRVTRPLRAARRLGRR